MSTTGPGGSMSTNEPMTKERLDAIQARVDGATTSPWDDQPNWTDTARVVLNGDGEALWDAVGLMVDADAEFIAHAREDIPALLTELDRLRGECQRLANETKHPAWANITDDLRDAAVERMARGLSEHWRDMHTNESLGRQRMLARAALAALLGGGDDA